MEVNYKLRKVRELASGDEGFVTAVASAFLEEVPHAIDQINLGLNKNDCMMVYQNAHKIKPTIQMFEIGILDDLLAIQDWGKFEKTSEDVSSQFKRVSSVIKIVVSEIKSDFSL